MDMDAPVPPQFAAHDTLIEVPESPPPKEPSESVEVPPVPPVDPDVNQLLGQQVRLEIDQSLSMCNEKIENICLESPPSQSAIWFLEVRLF